MLKKKIKDIVKKSYDGFLSFLPIKENKIFIDNFGGKGFGDNEKYIAEALHKMNPKGLDIVWFVNKDNENSDFPNYIRKVRANYFRLKYETATARVWIDNIKNFDKGKKKKGQFYLQTWHGAIALKKVEKAAEDVLSKEYVKASKFDSTQIDLMISNSAWYTNNIRRDFWYEGPIADTGIPRNDVFFGNIQAITKKVKDFYNIPSDTEIILYAPTFRASIAPKEQIHIYSFDENRIIGAFQKKYNKKFVMIKRMHPNISELIDIHEDEHIKNGSRYPDMQELLIASFSLITDFSSSMFDFMLIKNQIYIYAPDYQEYIKRERALNFNIHKDLPFPFSETEDELVDNINGFSEGAMSNKIQKLKNEFGLHEDGHASERVARIILNQIRN